ncbi:MAG: YdcF family protein [Bdellovibrionales bacterium]
MLVLLLLLSAFFLMARRESWQVAGRRLTFDIAFLMFFIAIFPVGDWLLRPLENRFHAVTPEKVDGIVVIGSDESPTLTEIRSQPVAREGASRYLKFAALARQYPNAKLVYAGGSPIVAPVPGKLTNADVAREAMESIGLPVDRITFEGKSRNTYENAVNAAAIVHPRPDEKWLLVTTAFHMPRAMGCFRKAGWNVYAAPSNYTTTGALNSDLNFDFAGHLGEMNAAVREYYGLLAYWLMGYIESPWPK